MNDKVSTMKMIQGLFAAVLLFAASSTFAGTTYGTLSANGDTAVITVRGPVVFKASGTWGSGTIVVSRRGSDGNYKTLVTDTALTSDATGQILIDFPENTVSLLKATLSGATAPSIGWEFIGVVTGTGL